MVIGMAIRAKSIRKRKMPRSKAEPSKHHKLKGKISECIFTMDETLKGWSKERI
jgi:hypothetical protein